MYVYPITADTSVYYIVGAFDQETTETIVHSIALGLILYARGTQVKELLAKRVMRVYFEAEGERMMVAGTALFLGGIALLARLLASYQECKEDFDHFLADIDLSRFTEEFNLLEESAFDYIEIEEKKIYPIFVKIGERKALVLLKNRELQRLYINALIENRLRFNDIWD